MSSKRQYLTIAELEEFADITVNDPTEAYDQISQAEELIDAWVGAQDKAFPGKIVGEVTRVEDNNIIYDTDPSSGLYVTNNSYQGSYFLVVGGAAAGKGSPISASNREDRTVTLLEALEGLDSTSVYEIFQLAKFPRRCDQRTNRAGDTVYRVIPDAVRRATAAQVAYFIEMGPEYFAGQDADMGSERIMNYSYSAASAQNGGQSTLVKFIAPRARVLLRGITNRTGTLSVGMS